MQMSTPILFAGLWVYGFFVYFLFFKLFVWFAYSGTSPQLPVTHPLAGAGMAVLGGLYFALALNWLGPRRTSNSGSSVVVSGGCVAVLAAFFTFPTVAVLWSLFFVLSRRSESPSPFYEFLLMLTSLGTMFSVWFVYSVPVNLAFGTLAGKLLTRLDAR